MKCETLRGELMATGLARADLDQDPLVQFEFWYGQTMQTDMPEPTAMALATVDEQGQPWQRMVLLKLFDRNGFVFFTNYGSRKAGHIAKNRRVSLLFPWHALGRQVKITGSARKIPAVESMRYFASRPRGSQLGAWASHQSQVISSRAILNELLAQMKDKFKDREVSLPAFWGGYRVEPDTIEFWQARESRVHDRFLYSKGQGGQWTLDRLAP